MLRLFACLLLAASLSAETPPLVFQEEFEQGRNHWEVTDEKSWTHRVVDGNAVFGINRRESDYTPPSAARCTSPCSRTSPPTTLS